MPSTPRPALTRNNRRPTVLGLDPAHALTVLRRRQPIKATTGDGRTDRGHDEMGAMQAAPPGCMR